MSGSVFFSNGDTKFAEKIGFIYENLTTKMASLIKHTSEIRS